MAAFTNGQPWRIQPWNTEQDSPTLGPWTEVDLNLPTGLRQIGAHVAVSNGYVYSYGAFDNNYSYKSELLLAAPIDSEGVLGNWEIASEHSGFEFFTDDEQETSVPILTNKINEVWIARDLNLEGTGSFSGRNIMSRESNIITRNKIVSLYYKIVEASEVSPETRVEYLIFESEITPDGDIEDAYKITRLDTDGEIIFAHTCFIAKSKNGKNDRIYFGMPEFWYIEFDKKSGDIIYSINKASPRLSGFCDYNTSECCSVATAKRVYIFGGDYVSNVIPSGSAPINDDASIGEFTVVPYGEVFYPEKAKNAIITSSRIYVFTEYGETYWAPFRGGANDYTTYATYESGPGINPILVSGRYDVVPEVSGWGETGAAGTVGGRSHVGPVVGGEAKTVAAGTAVSRIRIAPDVSGEGETAPAGTVNGQVLVAPKIGGAAETVEAGAVNGRVRIGPVVEGKAETAGAGAVAGRAHVAPVIGARGGVVVAGTTAGRARLGLEITGAGETARAGTLKGRIRAAPVIEAGGETTGAKTAKGRTSAAPVVAGRGETTSARTMAGRVRIAPEIVGKGETAAAKTATGLVRICPVIRGRARTTRRFVRVRGRYALPLRVRGVGVVRVGEWVLRFRRPEVL